MTSMDLKTAQERLHELGVPREVVTLPNDIIRRIIRQANGGIYGDTHKTKFQSVVGEIDGMRSGPEGPEIWIEGNDIEDPDNEYGDNNNDCWMVGDDGRPGRKLDMWTMEWVDNMDDCSCNDWDMTALVEEIHQTNLPKIYPKMMEWVDRHRPDWID